MLVRLNQKYNFNRYRDWQSDLLPDDKKLLATLEEVEAERNLVLERLRFFGQERVQKKRRGNRQLSLEKQERLKQLRMGSSSSIL